MILLDTSVWIDVFRRHRPLDLEAVVDLEEVVTCWPVVQEVLQGFRDEGAFRVARDALLNLPIVEDPLAGATFHLAVDLYRACRRQGLTVRSSIDCLIAASALRHDLEVVHRDRDYDLLAKVSPLRARRI